MAVYEGNADRRLASQAEKILILCESDIPNKYRKDFHELISLIETAFKNLSVPGLTPVRLGRIKNKTAAKYIKLLFDIEDEVKSL